MAYQWPWVDALGSGQRHRARLPGKREADHALARGAADADRRSAWKDLEIAERLDRQGADFGQIVDALAVDQDQRLFVVAKLGGARGPVRRLL